MPYTVIVAEGEEFRIYESLDGDYKIQFLPPMRDVEALSGRRPTNLTLNGKPAFEANVMRIDFHKSNFDRKADSPIDPPQGIIQRAVGEYHSRLRFIARAAHAPAASFPWNQWRLEYTNDDGSPLEAPKGYVKQRGTIQIQWSFVAISREVWDSMFSLPHDFEVPIWDGLHLDAVAALPSVGTAVVLAATSLEVFISVLLDNLASEQGMSASLWEWIRDREGKILQQPSVEEQFDVLLKHFSGHSLKEDTALWEAFKNIKSARNSFVHEGIARVGNVALTTDDAAALVGRVNSIMDKIREWIPEKLRWPTPRINAEIASTHTITREASNQGSAVDA